MLTGRSTSGSPTSGGSTPGSSTSTTGPAPSRKETTTSPSTRSGADGGSRVPLAYFSRARENYDNGGTVLLASPIWNVRPPMIMQTLTDALDFTGKTVHPVVTYAVSGLGSAEGVYKASCTGATIGRPLAVRGETVADAGPQIVASLRASGLA